MTTTMYLNKGRVSVLDRPFKCMMWLSVQQLLFADIRWSTLKAGSSRPAKSMISEPQEKQEKSQKQITPRSFHL